MPRSQNANERTPGLIFRTLLGMLAVLLVAVPATIVSCAISALVHLVGHTDTLPDISARLGGPSIPALGLTEFDHLFVRAGGRLTHLR
jgi:hypothetical protein